MRTLTKIFAPAVAAAIALGSIAPASAADWRHEGQDYGRDAGRFDGQRFTPVRNDMFRANLVDLRRDIDRAQARRMISPREAAGLRADVVGIQRLHAMFSRNGLNRQETSTLDRKIDRVRAALRFERHDRDGRRF